LKYSVEQKIHYTLRIASAICFIGHGTWGIVEKPIWCNYFAVFGIPHDAAYTLMPYLGTIDIFMGIVILIYPMRGLFMWLVIWGFTTALLRPLSGELFAEFIERAGNYGAPLALLILSGGIGVKKIFAPVNYNTILDKRTMERLKICLRIVIFLLFLGHGWLNIIGKQGLLNQYRELGFANPLLTAHIVGVLEIAGAFSVLIRPMRSILFLLFIWKMISELFYPHYELFEWLERGGSYGSILALWFALDTASVYIKKRSFLKINFYKIGAVFQKGNLSQKFVNLSNNTKN
jgi:uncharacterized membrane protein YphA (DoxX/SURF4 family)